YALGIMLYEMLVGKLPYQSESWGELVLMHTSAPFPSVRQARPELPLELEELIAKAVAKDPARRFQSMDELRDRLVTLTDARTAELTPPPELSASGELLIPSEAPLVLQP